MRIVNLILCLLLILLLIFGCQAEDIPRPSSVAPAVEVELRYGIEPGNCLQENCSLAVAREKVKLRKMAEGSCQTAVSCISCCSAGLLTYAKIYVEPNCRERARYD